MEQILSAARGGKHIKPSPTDDAAGAAGTSITPHPPISLAKLESMADWREAIQGRIECQRVRLNLGLHDNDAQLSTEIDEFASECRRLCAQIRDARQRRAA